jgi:DNA-binding response OmpR family regulator
VIAKARSGQEAQQKILQRPAELVLLDIETAATGGIETCRRLRSIAPKAGIVMVAPCGCEEHKLQALEAGADDYVARPISLRLLLARLQALRRRLRRPTAPWLDYRFPAGSEAVTLYRTPEVVNGSGGPAPAVISREQHPAQDRLGSLSLQRLRTAIQRAEVSFPSQMPVFNRQSRADIQWRVVVLYFVRNWSSKALGQRYGVTMTRVRQILSQWVRRATALGYLQEIPHAGPHRGGA